MYAHLTIGNSDKIRYEYLHSILPAASSHYNSQRLSIMIRVRAYVYPRVRNVLKLLVSALHSGSKVSPAVSEDKVHDYRADANYLCFAMPREHTHAWSIHSMTTTPLPISQAMVCTCQRRQ